MSAMAFAIVWILIYVHVPFLFGYFTTQLFPSSFPVGKRNASMSCIVWGNIIVYEEITLDIRQNKNEDFITVLKCTKSGIQRMNNKSRFEGLNILSFHYDSCKLSYNSYNFIGLTVSLQSDVCILGSKTSASWRCLFPNGTHSFNSSEMNIYSIKGRSPQKMQSISIVNRQPSKSMYETGDVLQLQCIGEIESINAMPSKNIRWCEKENGTFKLISIQDPPRTNVEKSSTDGCTVVQKSVLFYRVSQNDTAVEVMCESGYGYSCGREGINATISIRTGDTQPDKWRIWLILIHDNTSLINPGNIVLDGSGKTIHLQCTASVHSHHTSNAKMINWCVRKQNNATWTEVKLQGKNIVTTSDINGEITIFSKIEYHVTIYDTDVHFMCEISHYFSCGVGLASSNISIHVVVEEAQNQNVNEPDCSKAGVAVLSVLFVVVVISMLLFLTILCRRRHITLFALSANGNCTISQTLSSTRYMENPSTSVGVQRSEIENNTIEDAKGDDMDQDCNDNTSEHYETTNYDITVGRQKFYENQALAHERNRSIYEDAIKKETGQDYDVLKL
uniref:Ig-like domain-containing protein n=1 Tax=Magallana gigas TaxID=29159 RepID=A0A8W8MBX3_MAGGI